MVASVALAGAAQAKVISFEEYPGFGSLVGYGVRDSYQGYDWGFGLRGGFDQKMMVDDRWGWAVTSADEAYNPAPHGVTGEVFAWNANGPQSLWIDFRTPTQVISADLAAMTSRDEYSNASSVRVCGYDADGALVFSTAALALTDTFQTLATDAAPVRYLEFRAEDDRKFFSVDRIVLGGVPEPRTWSLMILGFGLAGSAARAGRLRRAPR